METCCLPAHIQQVNTEITNKLNRHNQQTEAELAQLQTSLTIKQSSLSAHTQEMSAAVNTLTTDLSEQKTAIAELGSIQTSLISSLEAKVDTLTDTTVQLSSDHQQIQTSISEVKYAHRGYSNNLTCHLETIQHYTEYLPYTCGGTGWRRVVYLDMTDPSTTCPSGWRLANYVKRTCVKVNIGDRVCDSVEESIVGCVVG